MDSFQEVTVLHPDVIAGGVYEQDNLSIDVLSNKNHLTRKTISPNGYQGTIDYPAIENEFNRYGLINGVPYILDTVDDTIWQWDVDYWINLKTSLNLPDGEYDELYSVGDHYLLSVTDEVNNGLWEIGLTKKKLTDVSLGQNSFLFFTPQGFLQFYKNDQEIYETQWLDANLSNFFVPLNYNDFPSIRAAASTSGTVFNFTGPQYFQLLWLAYGEALPSYIELPLGWSLFKGCFSSFPRAFCIIEIEDQGFGLYELLAGEFVLDTMLDQSYSHLGIINVHAVGENRFMSVVTQGAEPHNFSLLSVSSTGTETILEAEVATDREWYSIIPSRDPAVFYWVGRETGKTQLYKARVAGDLTFKRNVEAVEEKPADQQGKNTDGEAIVDDNQVEDSSDEGIGSLPASISLMLLMLLIPRAKRKIH